MELSIDTLAIYERLKAANLDDKAAKELLEIFRDNAHSIIIQQKEVLATKGDITAVKSDIAAVKIAIATSKAEIIKWVAGMLIAQAAIVAAIVKLL